MLRQLLFNVFLAKLLFMIRNIDTANLPRDNTLYIPAKNADDVIESLQHALVSLFK